MMSTANKSIVFLALAFAISWAIVIGGWSAGVPERVDLHIRIREGSAHQGIGPALQA
jgi:hypothetical protein